MAPIESPEAVKPKKEKKEKKDKSSKKRARDEEAPADTDRKHKKSKSIAGAEDLNGDEANGVKKEKKKKKDKHADDDVKTEKKDKKKKKKHTEAESTQEEPAASDDEPEVAQEDEATTAADPDAMDIDTKSSSKIHQPSDIPSNPKFPFFNQTVSLYEPIYPSGWDLPITGSENQHLRHLKNRYVPSLRGVLLDYRNLALGQNPGRKGAATDDFSHALVRSKNEFGGGFGWLTADIRVFVPTRGAWMEGSVNLQTEGHIGVVCFGMFNASIEARRLPSTWKWISNDDAETGFEETASVITAADEHGVVRQIHSTGYWVDGDGEKVRGRVRFRIRNFDVGVSGDSTFLSLQGTMLDKKAEKELVATEAQEARERKDRKGGRWRERRTVPDFSMTRFNNEEDQNQQQTQQSAEEVREALEVPGSND